LPRAKSPGTFAGYGDLGHLEGDGAGRVANRFVIEAIVGK
jgi:hypothetical protein